MLSDPSKIQEPQGKARQALLELATHRALTVHNGGETIFLYDLGTASRAPTGNDPPTPGDFGVNQPVITFNRPTLEGNEVEYMRRAVDRGHTSSSGPFAAEVSSLLRSELGAADVLLTTSCTAALEMSGLLLDIQPGDIVVVPSFTFVTSALAFARAGARLRFADIEPTR